MAARQEFRMATNVPTKGLVVEPGVPWWAWLLIATLVVVVVLYFSMRREDPR